MKTSISTLLGFIVAVGVLIASLLLASSDCSAFVNYPSILVVIGGTIASCMMGFSPSSIFKTFGLSLKLFVKDVIDYKTLRKDIDVIKEWNLKIQSEGKLAYDSIGDEQKDVFLKYVFDVLSTGYSEFETKDFVGKKIEELYNNEGKSVELMRDMGANAPAFGMAGTLIGLILLLSQLNDPSTIGPGMSLALITTLYGVLFARIYCLPIANKMYTLSEVNLMRRNLYLEGIILIMQKKSTFYIEDKLNSFLDIKSDKSKKDKVDSED